MQAAFFRIHATGAKYPDGHARNAGTDSCLRVAWPGGRFGGFRQNQVWGMMKSGTIPLFSI